MKKYYKQYLFNYFVIIDLKMIFYMLMKVTSCERMVYCVASKLKICEHQITNGCR